VPVCETQAFLRQAFGRYGRPRTVRVDNGTPWGGSDLPTGLALWLAGLAVAVHLNPPRTPQHNGVIEHSQGTEKRWGEPGRCGSVAELQRRLDEADERQRERFPHRGEQSRSQVYAGLGHSGREYSPAWEEASWSLAQAEDLLAGYVVPRQVDQSGSVSLYSRNLYVGRPWRGQTVWVRYDPQDHTWMFSDAEDRLLQRKAAAEITRERICGLTATDGRTKRK
jgi:hypothetical protein